MLSDDNEKLEQIYYEACREFANLTGLRAVAEAAVKAEREGAAPVAFLIDWPDEPGLGHYFAEASCETGRSRPLYLHPPQASATVPEHVNETAKKSTHEVGRVDETGKSEHVGGAA